METQARPLQGIPTLTLIRDTDMENKRMWSVKIGNHIYILHNGQVIYKRWVDEKGKRTQPSLIFGKKGWPNEWVA
jgi:hypothetical protein